MELNKLNQIRNLIVPILELQQVDLIDIELRGKSGSQVLRIFVDIDGGISLDQCAALSQQISDLLDTRDLITGSYRLEVSSPGLDRPLKTERDFKRNLGRNVRLSYIDQQKVKTIAGTIDQVDHNMVLIQQDNKPIMIDISKISVAKIIPKW